MTFSVAAALNQIIRHESLSHEQMTQVMQAIMSGETSHVQAGAFLAALRTKSETVEEIAAAASVMREFSTHVTVNVPHLVDICGTGGDGAHTFNISTTAMFVAAAAGANVAKHGGRSVSSSTGSADLLEALGINIHLAPAQVAKSIEQVGVGFMFAQNHHPAMKHVAPVRKELGVRTVFNILGPLTNPAQARHQLMGVFNSDLVPIQAQVLKQLGSTHVLVVHADSGLDELDLHGATQVAQLKQGSITHYKVTAQQFGFSAYTAHEARDGIRATSVEASKALMMQALDNQAGPARDIVAFNAAGAILAADCADSWQDAVAVALKTIASGAAKQKLLDYTTVSQQLSQ